MSKIIKINTELFKQKPRTQKNVPERKSDNLSKDIKKKLIKRIKDHKNKESSSKTKDKKHIHEINSDDAEIKDEFDESIRYLEELSKQKQSNNPQYITPTPKRKNKSIKKHNANNEYIPVPTDIQLQLPTELVKPQTPHYNNSVLNDVPYGILKNGNKPTFREWNKTLKKKNNNQDHDKIPTLASNTNSVIPTPESTHIPIIPREQKLEEIKKKHNQDIETLIESKNLLLEKRKKENNETNLIQDKLKYNNCGFIQKKRKTIKNKYKIGKNNTSRKISILLKDIDTRREILSSVKNLKNKSLHEMKEYLFKHNLLKSTSHAPKDIIKKMYESAILTGDLVNTSKNNLQDEIDNNI